MQTFKSIVEIDDLPEERFDPAQWTAVIPAAGRGSRLGFPHPKILYPLLNRPILDWLIDALETVVKNFVFVLSPHGRELVEPILQRRLYGRFKVVIQDDPTGMGDAVLLTKNAVDTRFTLVIWGDQVTVSARTLKICTTLHESRAAALTLPSYMRLDPYIDLVRDEGGKLIAVHQSREGEIANEVGENDCGVFLFTSEILFQVLADARKSELGIGMNTREFNLLPILPKFESELGSVCTLRIHNMEETLGVNTKEEAKHVEEILQKRVL